MPRAPSQPQPPKETTFPCTLKINIPFPTHRLATIALHALQVDKELSPLVQRSFTLLPSNSPDTSTNDAPKEGSEDKAVLQTTYAATTNRMLRVSVNGFFESLGVVLSAMRELDGDVVGDEWRGGEWDGEDLEGENQGGGERLEGALRGLERVQGLQESGALGNV